MRAIQNLYISDLASLTPAISSQHQTSLETSRLFVYFGKQEDGGEAGDSAATIWPRFGTDSSGDEGTAILNRPGGVLGSTRTNGNEQHRYEVAVKNTLRRGCG